MTKRVTIQSAFGKREGTEVEVIDSNEQAFYVTLEDGTTLKMKPSIIQVVRLDDLWDIDGNPAYNVRSTFAVIASDVPEELRKRD